MKSRESASNEGQDQVGSSGNQARVLSLFSGAGGMDLGFEGGFDVLSDSVNTSMHPDWVESDHGNGWVRLKPTGLRTVYANDISESARRVWERNFTRRGHASEEFRLGSIVDLVKAHRAGSFTFPEADIVTGGFSCQDFSPAGKRAGFGSGVDHRGRPMTADTPTEESRGMLYRWMKDVISIVRPLAFVAENVGGMASLGDTLNIISEDFADAGYRVSAQTLFGPAYGVPQTRKRIIFVGLRRDALTELPSAVHPSPSHRSPDDRQSELPPYVTTSQALRGLVESELADDPSQRSFSKAKYVSGGYQGQIEICLDRPGPTIRAIHHGQIEFRRLSAEHGGHHTEELNSGLPERRLSVRECARLQTFPDDFEFVVPGSRAERVCMTNAYKAVGNAVPPLLAYHIAMKLKEIWPVVFCGR